MKMSGGVGLPAPKALAKFNKVDVDENVIASELFLKLLDIPVFTFWTVPTWRCRGFLITILYNTHGTSRDPKMARE